MHERGSDRGLGENVPVIGVERDQKHAAGATRLGEVVFLTGGVCECVVGVLCERHCVCKSIAVVLNGGHVDFDGGFEPSSCHCGSLADAGREKHGGWW